MYRRILIPTDGSSLSIQAVEHGVALARTVDASVILLTVTEPFHVFTVDVEELEATPREYKQRMTEISTEALAAAAAIASNVKVPYEQVRAEDEHPYEVIIRTAETGGCDLIVMASHGRRGMSALLLGSETMKVLTHSKIPVLVVR